MWNIISGLLPICLNQLQCMLRKLTSLIIIIFIDQNMNILLKSGYCKLSINISTTIGRVTRAVTFDAPTRAGRGPHKPTRTGFDPMKERASFLTNQSSFRSVVCVSPVASQSCFSYFRYYLPLIKLIFVNCFKTSVNSRVCPFIL